MVPCSRLGENTHYKAAYFLSLCSYTNSINVSWPVEMQQICFHLSANVPLKGNTLKNENKKDLFKNQFDQS